jgi:hypothetical protein
MAKLTAKQEAFIELMTQGEELARRGFGMLAQRADCEIFFDQLASSGFFEPDRNPTPTPADKEGYFYIPYWAALDYLVAVARLSGERNDVLLADKVMHVVRSVSKFNAPEGKPWKNYHTSRKFAEILGMVPTEKVELTDISLIANWLGDSLERGLVTEALDKPLARFLASSSPADWEKAVEILRHCTTTQRLPSKETLSQSQDYWLTAMLKKHASSFGGKVGGSAADLLLDRVREAFDSEGHKLSSVTYRPAIEDSEQNYRWREDENWSVEGLRDVLVTWSASEPEHAGSFLAQILRDELEIVRRIGIFVLDQHWNLFRHLYDSLLSSEAFRPGHFHELYNLLKRNFDDFTDEQKELTLQAIHGIPVPTWGQDVVRSQKRIQRQWLSAIDGKAYPAAEQWLTELMQDDSLGPPSDHPDFVSYVESRVGPGPSSYSVQDLIAFAKAGVVIGKLNSFEAKDEWKGPTLEGLTSTLEEAVKVDPEPFIQLLPQFVSAKRPFQYSLISALKQAWERDDGERTSTDWDLAWGSIVNLFEQIVGDPNFWDERAPETAAFVGNRDWVTSVIGDFLHVGTRNDKRAFSSSLLPRIQSLIKVLLENAPTTDRPSDDAMLHAINSPKGKAVEALFSYSLTVCRSSDKTKGSHAEAWTAIVPVFNGEIEKCKAANYEFSTLAGAYLPQLDYLDRAWTKANIARIFPEKFSSNSICALDGLAYAQFAPSIYGPLAEQGVLDRGLRYELKGRNARDKLLQRIAAGYLWGEEPLQSSRFSYIFASGRIKDAEIISRVFWSVRNQEIPDSQKELIVKYWERCVEWCREFSKPPTPLYSALSTLSCYLDSADGKDGELLYAVAPHVHDGFNASNFFEQLLRLAETSPVGVHRVLGRALEAYVPSYDFEDRLKLLLIGLAKKGQDVLLYVELTRMQDVYDFITDKERMNSSD